MSVAGGVSKAFERAQSIDCGAMQIFTRNQNQWKCKPLETTEIARYHEWAQRTGITPVVAHASYLINLGSPSDELWSKSVEAYQVELERADQLSILGVVLHPGSSMGAGEEAGKRRIAQGLDRVHAATSAAQTLTLLEITAGQGDHLGFRFEQLADIIAALDAPGRVGICFDTCHALAAGYEFRNADDYQRMWDAFDKALGLERLKVFHLNDSKKDLGSRVDRHTHIGEGFLGLTPFRLLLNDARFQALPMILETPKEEDMADDVMNLARLRELIAR
jgi:deoxyribonuclease-4